MSNISEIYDFGNVWRDTINFQVSPVGNYFFSATVTYKSKLHGTERESCMVQMIRNGMQDGDITIFANGILQNETHHLGFSENWQSYKFDDKDGVFVVTGKSQKMGGEYSVRIYPNGVEPSFR